MKIYFLNPFLTLKNKLIIWEKNIKNKNIYIFNKIIIVYTYNLKNY